LRDVYRGGIFNSVLFLPRKLALLSLSRFFLMINAKALMQGYAGKTFARKAWCLPRIADEKSRIYF
jgi:hypothetical protein